MLLIFGFALLLLFVFGVDFLVRQEATKRMVGILGPRVWPLVGDMIVMKIGSIEGVLKVVLDYLARYGKTVRFWAFNELFIIVTDPAVLEAVLSSPKHIKKPRLYNFFKAWLGDCIVVSAGNRWAQQRKLLTSAFHFGMFDDFVQVFEEQSSILVERLKDNCGKGAFDVNPFITAAALDVIAGSCYVSRFSLESNHYFVGCRNCNGYQIKFTDNTRIRVCECNSWMVKIVTERTVRPELTFDWTFRIFAPNLKKKHDNYIKILHNRAIDIIEQRRKLLLYKKEASGSMQDAKELGIKRKMNLIDVLLQSYADGKLLTNEEIRIEVDAFMFGGHDTVNMSVNMTLYCLSKHPDVQDKTFDEIRQVIGDDKFKSADLMTLKELKYLEAVIKESLRLYPPAPNLGRVIEEDLQVGNIIIPAKSNIFVPIFHIQRDPDVYAEPEKFIPERFLGESPADKLHPYSYLPFSAGPRNCLGKKFGMIEMKTIVSKILRFYELLPMGERPKLNFNILTSSSNGVNIGIKSRLYN